VRAVDASTVNGLHNAEHDLVFQPKSTPRPIAAFYREANRPVPDVDGRGRDPWPPIFFRTNRRSNRSLRRFALDGENSRRTDGGFQPTLERPARKGPAATHPWRRRASGHPENPPARGSRPVQASPTNGPSIRPFGHASTRRCCTFCCTFCCIKPDPKWCNKTNQPFPINHLHRVHPATTRATPPQELLYLLQHAPPKRTRSKTALRRAPCSSAHTGNLNPGCGRR
jgi:hypothetical protein